MPCLLLRQWQSAGATGVLGFFLVCSVPRLSCTLSYPGMMLVLSIPISMAPVASAEECGCGAAVLGLGCDRGGWGGVTVHGKGGGAAQQAAE